MFSLQSHNQVLYHLTQLTATITPRSTPLSVQVKQKSDSGRKRTKDILCKSSFLEAVRSVSELAIDKLNVQNLAIPLRFNNHDVWEILEQLSKKNKFKIVEKCSKWNMSYISGLNFTENKRDFSFPQLSNRIINLSPICVYIPYHQNGTQVRCFKTDRNIKAEYDRNPTFSTRIRKWFGLIIQSDNKLKRISNQEANTITVNEHNIEKLRKNQDDRYMKAFAEGFVAGQEQKPQGRAFRLLRLAQQAVFTVLLVLLLAALVGAYRSTAGGSVFKIQLGNRVQVDPEEIHVTFNDVKGVEEAKSELMDIVEFLRNPDKFSALGGKLPKGVLLVGPPGTGKTLLARAVAGEAGVPFFHAAGPEFDEVLVGQGARRVRDLFKAAKERAPCVIFIDEIDSVGAKRTNSALHPYANQTINQLLSEMDGFHQNEGVIVLGATNRRQDLDKALLRPGRFDSEITVNAPDFSGRKEILNLYLGRILTRNINAEKLAKCTTGFTGADIENMINQAALRAAIEGAEYVTMDHLERARDKVIMGPEGKRRMMNEEENCITAYHEGGHALVSYFTKDATPLHKVTIIPRGQSLGHTSFLPEKDKHYRTKAEMLATMDACMGGRAAEELIFGQDKVTSGASKDFLHATEIAEAMVKIYGMSEKVGFRVHKDPGPETAVIYSSGTKELIDNEVKRLLQESYDRAKTILKNHSKEHKLLAEALLKYETLDAEDVKALVSGKQLRYEVASNGTRSIVDVPNNVM